MVSIPLLIFTASVCIAIFKPSGGRLIFILISLGINPIANQFGIFSSARISMVGNIFMHLIYPIILNPKALRTLLSRTGLLVLTIIFFSTLQLAFSVDSNSNSYTAGFKTILLMLGSWFWAQSLSIEIIRNYGYLTNRFLIKELFIVSILVLIVSLFFRNLYFLEGRYQAAGGFTSPAILSALIIILILMCSEIRTYLRIAVIAFEIAILISTGSRGVLIALLVSIVLISMNNALKAKKVGDPIGLRLIPNIFVLISVIGFFFIDILTRYRSFEFLNLLNSDSEERIGTLGFRQDLFARMIDEYQNFSLIEKLFGLGAGSGTSLAMNYISSLRDSNYTSSRVFHNGFLQLLIEAGFIGVILFLFFALAVFHYRKSTHISGFGYIWTIFYLIALFFTSNPFATSGLLAGLIYTVFFVPTYRIRIKDDH